MKIVDHHFCHPFRCISIDHHPHRRLRDRRHQSPPAGRDSSFGRGFRLLLGKASAIVLCFWTSKADCKRLMLNECETKGLPRSPAEALQGLRIVVGRIILLIRFEVPFLDFEGDPSQNLIRPASANTFDTENSYRDWQTQCDETPSNTQSVRCRSADVYPKNVDFSFPGDGLHNQADGTWCRHDGCICPAH